MEVIGEHPHIRTSGEITDGLLVHRDDVQTLVDQILPRVAEIFSEELHLSPELLLFAVKELETPAWWTMSLLQCVDFFGVGKRSAVTTAARIRFGSATSLTTNFFLRHIWIFFCRRG